LMASAIALTSAFATMAVPAQAQASTETFEGFDPNDPVGSAVKELMRLAREKCGLADRKVVVGVASLPTDVQAFTRDQGNHLMGVVHAAFSRMQGIRMAPFRDVGAIVELRSVGLTTTSQAGDAERLMQEINLVVQATGQKFGPNIRFQLAAIGRNDLNCYEVTPMVNIPQSMAGEVFIPAENIFNSAARELWERSRGFNQVAVESKSVTGAPVDAHLPGYFAIKLRQAVTTTRSQVTENLGTPTELEVVQRREATAERQQRWDADVLVEQRANGYKISVDVTRPNTTPISHFGIVSVEDLPALRRADLTRVAAIARPQLPPKPNQPRMPQAQRASAGDAAMIQFSLSPTRIQDTLDDQNREQRYAFKLERESFVELDVLRLSGSSQVIAPDLAGSNGMPIKALFEGKARPNLRRYRLQPGDYEVRLTTEGQGRHEYVFSSRAVDIGRMLEPEAPGRLTRRFQDWYAGETRRAGKKVCYVFTTAMEVAPVGWREQRPIIWLSLSEDASEPLNHMLDDVQRYSPNKPVKAMVEGEGGLRPLEVKALNTHLQPVTMNAAGQAVLNRDAIRGYTVGSMIELRGETLDGKPAQIRYSLLGYRSAVNAAALNCNRPDLTRDLVWK
jgi:hypothetical protein